jgi:hypothetical protein
MEQMMYLNKIKKRNRAIAIPAVTLKLAKIAIVAIPAAAV